MCGIVGAVSTRNIVPILVEGLQRLEYRGYDSCGVAVHADGELQRARSTSRVAELDDAGRRRRHVEGGTGIAHTRWATHGAPAVHNAHPHFSHGPASTATRRAHRAGAQRHHREPRRAARRAAGHAATSSQSQTDTEVIAHLVDSLYDGDLFDAVQRAVPQLHGAYAIAVFCRDEPHRVVGARARLAADRSASARRRRELPRLRRDGAGRRDRPDRLPRRRRRGRPAARQATGSSTPTARTGATRDRCDRARAQRRRRAGPVPPLHAEGNLRAAARDRRHAAKASPASCPSCSATAPTASSRRSTRC